MAGPQIIFNLARPDRPQDEVVRRLGAVDAGGRIFILNGHAQSWSTRSNGGAFSLKWAPRGGVTYATGGRTRRLSPENLLLINAGQPYELAMSSRDLAETFCVFFSDGLVREAWADAETEDPDGYEAPGEFPNLPFRPDPALGEALTAARKALPEGWPRDLEARLLLVLADAVRAAKRHRRGLARLPAVKASTREHLLGRLEAARGLIEEGVAPDLPELARRAGVSKFHLLRLFRAVYGCTPMRYAEGRRLDRAADSLRRTRRLIEEIAYEAGYESLTGFGRAFRRRHGAAPSAFRARN